MRIAAIEAVIDMARSASPLLVGAALACSTAIQAADLTWVGPSNGDWFADGNWTGSGTYPQAGDAVFITNGYVLLSNATPSLSSFAITNASLVFTNWDTVLNAVTVTVRNAGALTLPPAFTTNQMSNRVWVICTNMAIDTGGKINADGMGYSKNNGPGKQGGSWGGGAYGGKGGDNGNGTGGLPYGSTNAPSEPGSGGSHAPGGGVIRLAVSGSMTMNGLITANGNDYSGGGGGAGGAIYITCDGTFTGDETGILRANGGAGSYGSGGGGRMALVCSAISRDNVKVHFTVSSGTATNPQLAGIGTLFLSNTNLMSETLDQFDNVWITIPDYTGWEVDHLAITNRMVAVGALGNGVFTLAVSNDLVVEGGGFAVGGIPIAKGYSLSVSGADSNPVVTVGGNLLLTNSGALVLGASGQGAALALRVGTNVVVNGTNSALTVGGNDLMATGVVCVGGAMSLTNGGNIKIYSGPTNATTENYGMLVYVSNTLSIGPASWIYPYSQRANGGSILFRLANLAIATNSGFNADAKGYSANTGPGKATTYSGAGHGGSGGHGGQGGAGPGIIYDSTNAPIMPGSGGNSGAGGGVVRIETAGNITIDGLISANGQTASGAGAGGAIYIDCGGIFSGGSGGQLLACGGNGGNYGGGGGGRIAVQCATLDRDMVRMHFSTAGGTNSYVPAGMGTVFFPSTNMLSPTLFEFDGGRLVIPGFTAWNVDNLAISNRVVGVEALGAGLTSLKITNDLIVVNGGFAVGGLPVARGLTDTLSVPASNPVVNVGGNILLTSGGAFVLGVSGTGTPIVLCVGTNVIADGSNSALVVGGTNQMATGTVYIGSAFTLTNGASARFYSGATNTTTTNYGAVVSAGLLSIGPASWIYPYSQRYNGGSILFNVDTLTVATNAGINADYAGYWASCGPGKGVNYGGGAYGGKGGDDNVNGTCGLPYGTTNKPFYPGSGGSHQPGGGNIRVEASGAIELNGIVTANGKDVTAGGAGGGIFLVCGGTFTGGTNGIMRANGGIGAYGGGGGGRIAVWRRMSPGSRAAVWADDLGRVTVTNTFDGSTFLGTVSVTNGTGPAADPALPGSIVLITGSAGQGTLITIF